MTNKQSLTSVWVCASDGRTGQGEHGSRDVYFLIGGSYTQHLSGRPKTPIRSFTKSQAAHAGERD